MTRIRTLIVDDAVVIRRVVAEALAGDPDIEVIGTAPNGRIALAKLAQGTADAVILDIEMPELDGLRTLKEIRRYYPHLPVIMFSTYTERGAAATIEALSLGASDYVTKPAGLRDSAAGVAHVQQQLLPKIKGLCRPDRLPPGPRAVAPSHVAARAPESPTQQFRAPAIVVIGASTGGPNALQALLAPLPADLGAPVVVVQHMPALFTRLLAERLSSKGRLPVKEAFIGALLEPSNVWLAPGDFHVTVESDGANARLALSQDAPVNSCRPSVDVLFSSAARLFGPRTLAIVLTGMGRDGLRGCEEVREAGGEVLAQDQASSVVWGMPGFVANAGLASATLPPEQLGYEIARRLATGPAGWQAWGSAERKGASGA